MGAGISIAREWERAGLTYPLLCEAAGALVLGVAEQFDDTLLVRGKTAHNQVSSHSEGSKTRNIPMTAGGRAPMQPRVAHQPEGILHCGRTQQPHG
jgi:hypothetical protein